MKRGICISVGLAALLLSILACGSGGDDPYDDVEEDDYPPVQEDAAPPAESDDGSQDADDDTGSGSSSDEPAAEQIDIAEQLEFGGGGGDGVPFICPDNASGAGPSVVFGRDRAPYEYGRLCIYDLDLTPGNELTLTLISPEGDMTAVVYFLEADGSGGLIATPFGEEVSRLFISETGYGTYQAEMSVFLPPAQPAGEWLIEINNGVMGPVVIPLLVDEFTHEALFVVSQNSNPFYAPLCCYSGEPVRYEGAGLIPDHFYMMGGYIMPPESPSDGVRLFQTEVFTDSAGVFVIYGVAPASGQSGKFCLALFDPETESLILEDVYLGSLCRTLNP